MGSIEEVVSEVKDVSKEEDVSRADVVTNMHDRPGITVGLGSIVGSEMENGFDADGEARPQDLS